MALLSALANSHQKALTFTNGLTSLFSSFPSLPPSEVAGEAKEQLGQGRDCVSLILI